MKELSVFIDESGDFGAYAHHSPYYIITMVFHDQSFPINEAVSKLEQELKLLGLEKHCVHIEPIIRKEEDYVYMDIKERRRILTKILAFYRQVNIRYKCFHIEKKHIADTVEASGKLSKSISAFIREGFGMAFTFDNLVNIPEDSNLCFRPLEPKIEAELYHVWKKYQIFTKPAELFSGNSKRGLICSRNP